MDLLGWSGDFWLIRFRPSNLHVVSVVLINRVVAFTFTLCRFDPNHVSLVLPRQPVICWTKVLDLD